MVRLSDAQREQYRRDGYLVIEDVFDAATMDAARGAMDQALYGMEFETWQAKHDAGDAPVAKDGVVHNRVSEEGLPLGDRSQFPTGVDALDRLIEDDGYLDLIEQVAGGERPDGVKLKYCNAHLFGRAGATDKRHPSTGPFSPNAQSVPWESYHMDHGTNSRLPPSVDFNRFSYVNTGVYLHDVEPDGAPMLVCPGSHLAAPALFKRLFEQGVISPGAPGIPDLREATEISKPVPAVGRKGAVLIYSSYLIHAAQPFVNKRVQRAMWTLSICRADTASFNKLSNPWDGPDRDYMLRFAATTTPRVLDLFDTEEDARERTDASSLPPPGHSYYTEQTLELLEWWAPDTDLNPFRKSLVVLAGHPKL
jgi:ectoine hydroxylase-related dioxygenase (phytanoyl-CoA dioxygenase family)